MNPNAPKAPQKLAILGSTGSIGTQALDVISRKPELFKATVLTAHSRAELLIEQARQFLPDHVVIVNESKYSEVKEALSGLPIEVHTGADALVSVVCLEQVDMVLTALVGFSGLRPTMAAIEHGKPIALANKETLVVAGEIVMAAAAARNVPIIPVDSEHSALFQCMVGEEQNPVEKIYLTASGGPFRGFSLEQLRMVTKAQALKHPNWEMGAKITIDSASMMNKGLEVIEAKWLFDLDNSQIDVIVHPQSIIHSIVQFEDGSMKAQMGLPDMRLPIQYAMAYPQRVENDFPRFNFLDYPSLTFEQVDTSVFKNLDLAFRALDRGGNMACILNAANEITNRMFLDERIRFTDIADFNEAAMEQVEFIPNPSLEDLFETDSATRAWVRAAVEQVKP
ncbi:1-deoxy-D-xylulose-5-phosphate reductoisomerase [Pontibacter sp. G13]|uniref:1-deoxy-D-xylulose-5-phosphate reductoisomerase n=1 Tax=Pontibacter sp. G13 TaxID=3074898 RepID=UPI0028898E38|nr:1-deoxy-D-xylulose-5-phosphate reductoisomerase [Pontibacter sp. G13]WNJ19887.1 1-deoxy-D-xylulose-5-phosphate reductoisomerase [Pontibacter sp. G13]